MGSLILPSSGPVYADALIFIYSVEKHPIYALTLRPLWEAVARGDLEVLSSELTLIETLIGPLKRHCLVLVGSILIPRIDHLRFATRIQSHNPAPADTIPARNVTRFCS